MAQYHFTPDTYDALMSEEVPSYERLQQEVAAAAAQCSRDVTRILDLGTGTGITASRVIEAYPRARLIGIDQSFEMLAAAQCILPAETNLSVSRLEDPLPPGPFELVVSALAVHHLEAPSKADLIRRIARILEPGGRFVLGDLIVPNDPRDIVTPIDGVFDKPSTAAEHIAWLRSAGFTATITWRDHDLAVFVGELEISRESKL